ncbi:hypothetical protein [Pelomonas sp. SE-A7]|uniref:hypothetical protein n=1 Tax=Pelomonas sp. SE-A7 TaxID=3054953 RepID=UPI00259CDAD1|nr:hypothetical protein [Pelomonas sp. SE-A7]MDM4768546.1 hypothetical protein [Pelomonas sp. SE-A7]
MPTFNDLVAALSSPIASERNKAAVALMDIADSRAVQPLIHAIENPDNRNARGTLVYALSAFDCSGRFAQLFGWALEGGFETSNESISILHDQEIIPSEEDLLRSRAALEVAAQKACFDSKLKEELLALLGGVDG